MRGVVWCPHLRTGIFLARANGKTFWTGNTGIPEQGGANNDIFDQATKAALNLSTAMGSDLRSATVQVGKALNDPVKGCRRCPRWAFRSPRSRRP